MIGELLVKDSHMAYSFLNRATESFCHYDPKLFNKNLLTTLDDWESKANILRLENKLGYSDTSIKVAQTEYYKISIRV